MAIKKNKGSHVTPDITEDPRPEGEAASNGSSEPAEAKPALTTEQLRAMFDSYKTEDKKVREHEESLETAKKARSSSVKSIVDAVGHKGPYLVDGERMTVSVRGETYSFRKESEARTVL